jgi:hypothetical protein
MYTELKERIKEHEGYCETVYEDTLGFETGVMDIRSYLVKIYRQTDQDGRLYLRVIFNVQLMVLRTFLVAMILLKQLVKLLSKWFSKWGKLVYQNLKTLYHTYTTRGI